MRDRCGTFVVEHFHSCLEQGAQFIDARMRVSGGASLFEAVSKISICTQRFENLDLHTGRQQSEITEMTVISSNF